MLVHTYTKPPPGMHATRWGAITMLVSNDMRLPVQQIALQLALTFAKVARLDYPSAWPSLFGMHIAALANLLHAIATWFTATLLCFCICSAVSHLAITLV
jgi:hypothetical protein